MKLSIFTVLLFLSIGFKGLADCAGTGLYVFPAQKEIKKTSLFLLEGYAESQHVIHGLNTKHSIYLQSGNERIALEVIETHIGQFYLTQALLKPEKSLTPGKHYQLVIDSLPAYEQFGNYNSSTQKYDPIVYLIKDESDIKAPDWDAVVSEKSKSLQHFGCGPDIHVTFDFKATDDSEIWALAKVKSVETGNITSYILHQSNLGVSVGHGMCSGAFTFNEGVQFQVRFSLMDSSGNKASNDSEWVAFTKPVD